MKCLIANVNWKLGQNNYQGPTITRNELGVIASNRCILFGKVCLLIDGKEIQNLDVENDKVDIITLPTCRTVKAQTPVKKMIIIEKESIFYEIVNSLKSVLVQEYILICAKGYPDQTTRKMILSLADSIDVAYFLGDYDVFGFDIFLLYALGDWVCPGILAKIQIIKLSHAFKSGLFDWKDMEI